MQRSLLASMYAALRFAVGCRGDRRHPGRSVSAAEQQQAQQSPSPTVNNGMDVAASPASLGALVAASAPTYHRATCPPIADP